ncbi:hypothetical protein HMPREF0673_01375 [Leyella stercorea DSM 18206]|uniref:Uncharacterized protein n=1 Tax=Leyella stercorea DSM 18206 TaxID=1002367 RepID=G6AXL9_9BACT|nr:hypothetical protein HMPREF0673_01375 [Leyella stercorea DSM 18206]
MLVLLFFHYILLYFHIVKSPFEKIYYRFFCSFLFLAYFCIII